MARVKRGLVSHRKHKKLLDLTRGYRGTKSKLAKVAKEAALHAGEYAFAGRKNKKRDFRRLWITRIGEAVKAEGTSYSRFMAGVTKSGIKIDRKILSDLVLNDLPTFKKIVDQVKN
ncbi:MAG: 50S ribosomal protein L20 [Candidatus Levybacteria bacterium RIFCSPHIGHO2_01_FULL_40_10]|nr:MAG: 50S ribosomal protein L20 [Candidatus Levybacteria bacterium RIFCSPHIGHO2_01_FULL_40_10]